VSKFIPLKVLAIPNLNPEKKPDTFDYKRLLCDIITKPANAQVGMDMAEVQKSALLARTVQMCEAPSCEVTDEDYEFIVRKVKAVRWQLATPELVQFLTDVVQE
jgi:hypothetical protein